MDFIKGNEQVKIDPDGIEITGASNIVVKSEGKIGIGTNNPQYPLQVNGSQAIFSNNPEILLFKKYDSGRLGPTLNWGTENYTDWKIKAEDSGLKFMRGINGNTYEKLSLLNDGTIDISGDVSVNGKTDFTGDVSFNKNVSISGGDFNIYDNDGNTSFSVYGTDNSTTTTFSDSSFINIKASSTITESQNNSKENIIDYDIEQYWRSANKDSYTNDPNDMFDRSQPISSSNSTYLYSNGVPNAGSATETNYSHGENLTTGVVNGEWIQVECANIGVVESIDIGFSGSFDWSVKEITILGSNSSTFDWSDPTKWFKIATITNMPKETTAYTFTIPKTNFGTAVNGPDGTSQITPYYHANTAYKHYRFVAMKSHDYEYVIYPQIRLTFSDEPLFIRSRVSSSRSEEANFKEKLRDYYNAAYWRIAYRDNYRNSADSMFDRSQSISSSNDIYLYSNGVPNVGSATETYYTTNYLNNHNYQKVVGEWVQYEYDKEFIIDNIVLGFENTDYSAKDITILGSNSSTFNWSDPTKWFEIAKINGIDKGKGHYTFTFPKTYIGVSVNSPASSTIRTTTYVNYPFKNFRFVITATQGDSYAIFSQIRMNHAKSHTTETVAKIANAEYLNVNNITAPSIKFFSDSRIKNDITIVDDTKAIDLVNKLESKEYGYIDPYNKKTQKTIGFIAQEVNDVLPNAVSIQKGFIPDEIREITNPVWNASTDGSWTLTISDILFQSNHTGKCRFYFGETKKDIQVETDRVSFKFNRKWDNVYLWGKEINDFHMIDKNQIFALHHSAIQELSRRNDEKSAKILVLEESNEEKDQKLLALEERISAVEKLLQETTTLQNNTQETQNTESTSLFQKV